MTKNQQIYISTETKLDKPFQLFSVDDLPITKSQSPSVIKPTSTLEHIPSTEFVVVTSKEGKEQIDWSNMFTLLVF